MGIFGTLFELTVDVVKLPVAVVADVVTLGGAATDRGSYIAQNLEEIKEDLDEITD